MEQSMLLLLLMAQFILSKKVDNLTKLKEQKL